MYSVSYNHATLSHINLLHVNEAARGMHWGTAAKRYFKRFIDLFFIILGTQTSNSSRTFVFLPALYTVAVIIKVNYSIFTSKRFL